MSRRSQLARDLPLARRLVAGLRYPLAGGALATCVVLGLCRYVTLGLGHLPLLGGILALVGAVIIWGATFRYATDCLVQTADGYADPPEVSLEDRAGNPRGLLGIHVLVIVVCILTALFARGYLWLPLAAAAMLLPAIDMSLVFDGSLVAAFNPATWAAAFARFGAAYLMPVAANAALAILAWLALAGTAHLPALLATPVFGFIATYLVLLDFHWMGLLVWHYRERLGMHPAAPAIAHAMGEDADTRLLEECAVIARTDPEEAAIRLRDRIREHTAPASVHTRFRSLLHQLRRNDLLLSHGQTWIAQLCAAGETRRALGVLTECRGIDATFVPDDPDTAVGLAELAARIGTRRLAGQLARAIVVRWPQHVAAERVARLARAEEPSA